jgi:hypothetical protein
MRGKAIVSLLVVLAASSVAGQPVSAPVQVDFATMPAGKPPAGFSAALTGKGRPGIWVIAEEATAPEKARVLAQTSTDRTDDRFPLCIYDELAAADVDVEITFKAVSGKVDRAAGIAVRLKDPQNYYVVRANALEDNVRFYRVVNGDRQQIDGASAKVPSAIWRSLRIRAEGDRFEVFFDGKRLFVATDRTFPDPGKVALWTKADSVTHFAALRIAPLKP